MAIDDQMNGHTDNLLPVAVEGILQKGLLPVLCEGPESPKQHRQKEDTQMRAGWKSAISQGIIVCIG